MRDRAPHAFGATAPLDVPQGVPQPSQIPLRDPVPEEVARDAAGREYDPLRLCIYTTIGLIAWLITPPLTVALFGSIGVIGYVRARRRGLVASRCFLGDTRLVITYLALLALSGAGYTIWRLVS